MTAPLDPRTLADPSEHPAYQTEPAKVALRVFDAGTQQVESDLAAELRAARAEAPEVERALARGKPTPPAAAARAQRIQALQATVAARAGERHRLDQVARIHERALVKSVGRALAAACERVAAACVEDRALPDLERALASLIELDAVLNDARRLLGNGITGIRFVPAPLLREIRSYLADLRLVARPEPGPEPAIEPDSLLVVIRALEPLGGSNGRTYPAGTLVRVPAQIAKEQITAGAAELHDVFTERAFELSRDQWRASRNLAPLIEPPEPPAPTVEDRARAVNAERAEETRERFKTMTELAQLWGR